MPYILIAVIFIILFIAFANVNREAVKKDINMVADKIINCQNNGINDINEIIKCLEDAKNESAKNFNIISGWFLRKPNYFNVPKNMEIKEENNEIVISYKYKIYNVNKGVYINKIRNN